MDPERWQKVSELFHAACEQPPASRKAFLSEVCRDDEVRLEVESLLGQDVSIDGPLERVAHHAGQRRLPHSIGRYRIRALVGEGGMGAVYEAEQENPRRTVALKIVRSVWVAPELLRRFAQESEALGRLQHPGIARIYESGAADTDLGPQPYFAMEFVRGLALLEYARQHGLKTRQRVELMVKICEAVDHAHHNGIIHRDLKPGNILVDDTGQPKILDFGVARVSDSEINATRQTNIGELIGTLPYMSPEQIRADPQHVDARSDVYSLGVLLYELVAERLPYEVSRQLPEASRAIREQDPAPLRELSRADRADLETVVRKALEKEKTRRYASAAELAADLGRFLNDEPILARPPGAMYQARKFARRHRALVSATAAVFLVLAAGIVVSTVQAIRANRERDRALRAEQVENAVNDFLQNDLLAQAGARAQARSGEPDPDLKVRTALDRAAERIGPRFGSQPLVEAAVRRTVGLAYFDLTLFGQAQAQLERAADLRKHVLGPEHPDTLASMNELGVLYNNQAKYEKAEALLTQVFQVRQRLLGNDHPDTLGTLTDLAMAISYKGDDARAEPLLARALAASFRVRGDEHPDTASVLDDLGNVSFRLGKFARAEALLRQELEMNRRLGREGHPDTINGMQNLASVYRAEGNYSQADRLYATVLDARIRGLGEKHWQTQNTRFTWGISYRAQGEYTRAAALMNQAADELTRILGAEHPLTLQAIYNLAEVYRLEGHFAQAESLFTKVLEARRRVLGADNPYTAQVLESLGALKLRQRRYADAEGPLRESLHARETKSPETWERYYSESMLGASLAGQRKYGKAEPLLASGYQGLLTRQAAIPMENRPAVEQARRWRDQLSRP